jgi:hypothetical protein
MMKAGRGFVHELHEFPLILKEYFVHNLGRKELRALLFKESVLSRSFILLVSF